MLTVLWRLHGATAKDVECRLSTTPAGCLLTLRRNAANLLSEHYPDAVSANTRAGMLKDGLIAKGWTQVPLSEPAGV